MVTSMKIKELFDKMRRGFLHWLKQLFIWLDQGVNVVLFFGYADETISARCWRLRDCFGWKHARQLIDKVLRRVDPNHCEESYQSEVGGKQLPKEYQRRKGA